MCTRHSSRIRSAARGRPQNRDINNFIFSSFCGLCIGKHYHSVAAGFEFSLFFSFCGLCIGKHYHSVAAGFELRTEVSVISAARDGGVALKLPLLVALFCPQSIWWSPCSAPSRSAGRPVLPPVDLVVVVALALIRRGLVVADGGADARAALPVPDLPRPGAGRPAAEMLCEDRVQGLRAPLARHASPVPALPGAADAVAAHELVREHCCRSLSVHPSSRARPPFATELCASWQPVRG
eukprot:COSAG02_NODE_2149_length_9661_cov_2.215436_4_plen_238_part_00